VMALALDHAALLQQAEALSVTDDLTGLHNSRYLRDALHREAKRAVRYGRRCRCSSSTWTGSNG